MNHNRETISQEIWEKVGEQLEMLPFDQWNATLVNLLLDLLANEKNYNDYLKLRLEKSQGNANAFC